MVIYISPQIEKRYNQPGTAFIILSILMPLPLNETFGMWTDQKDIPADGVKYVDQIRRGRQLWHR